MSTPVQEKPQLSYPAIPEDNPDHPLLQEPQHQRSSDEDGTLQEEFHNDKDYDLADDDHPHDVHFADTLSTSRYREQANRLEDNLRLLQAEQMVSKVESEREEQDMERRGSLSVSRSKSRAAPQEPVDDFDVSTNPIHQVAKAYLPPARPATNLAKFFVKLHQKSFLVRYFFYVTPVMLLLLIPTLLGLFVFKRSTVGGVELFWFGIWLEIVWLTLWLSRIIAKMIPYPMGMVSSLFTNNAKKWRDLGKQLEMPATIFFWTLAIEVSFLPTMKNHHLDGASSSSWESIVNKIIIAIFVAGVLNFIEKILIQLIAISFHTRTYSDRIELNKFQIASLVKLYMYSKEKIAMADEEFEQRPDASSSFGARTPKLYAEKVHKNARQALNKVGDVAGKVAGDFTGRAVTSSTHPHQVVLSLLNSTSGSQVLARRLYRTYTHEGADNVFSDDLRHAFDNDEEADAAFSMFDKDMNGDISMDELEAVCVDIGRERKAITASLKDLDSVVSKLNDVFVFIVIVITILVFISLISTSASTALTSLGSTVLALSWLFSATAQEFLQSLIFVFVKHPFDVGDRVTIYGSTGTLLQGDDYFVKEISLLFTEFKKMEGHVVQAPNSYLNTLFILNQRRSGGLAEAVPIVVKFGTSLEQIDGLRRSLLEFVTSENREYQKNILTELRTVTEAYSLTLNVVFFYKSNWQNELLRLQRRNKFICAMMVSMQELGIEGPRLGHVPGASHDYPMYMARNNDPNTTSPGLDRSPDSEGSQGFISRKPTTAAHPPGQARENVPHSILRNRRFSTGRQRGESISDMGKRVDFSLGMQNISSGADMGDIYERPKPRIPSINVDSPPSSKRASRETGRPSEESGSIAPTLSRESQLGRTKSRLFSRAKGRTKSGMEEDGTNLDDLEAGRRDTGLGSMPGIPEASAFNIPEYQGLPRSNIEAERRDTGLGNMPDIPEASPLNTPEYQGPPRANIEAHGDGNDLVMGKSGSGRATDGAATLDPRTGIVRPQAVQIEEEDEGGELPASAAAGATTTDEAPRPISRGGV